MWKYGVWTLSNLFVTRKYILAFFSKADSVFPKKCQQRKIEDRRKKKTKKEKAIYDIYKHNTTHLNIIKMKVSLLTHVVAVKEHDIYEHDMTHLSRSQTPGHHKFILI